jgi:endonuclease/exonuclease/phosphatase family metal-dependent hydrolase
MNLKVMSFNLQVDNKKEGPNSWPIRVVRAGQAIQRIDPLIIGTQEGTQYMLDDLQQQLPGYGWIGSGRDQEGGEHCAIFYKKDEVHVKEWGQFWLSEEPEQRGSEGWDTACPRVCTWGHMQFTHFPHQEFLFFNTHLDHMGEIARTRGIQLVMDRLNAMRIDKPLPAILTGDMNATPDSDAIRFLRGELTLNGVQVNLIDAYSVLSEVGATFHSYGDAYNNYPPIDYIFMTQDVKVLHAGVDRKHENGGFPSDHYPIFAELQFDM